MQSVLLIDCFTKNVLFYKIASERIRWLKYAFDLRLEFRTELIQSLRCFQVINSTE